MAPLFTASLSLSRPPPVHCPSRSPQVLKRHAGSEEVLASSTRCLSSMVTNPEYASALLKSGAMASMVESVIQNPDAEKVCLLYYTIL